MGTVNANHAFASQDSDRDGWNVSWSGLKGGDTGGNPSNLIGFADHTIQVEGVFNGASVAILGSNDGQNFRILHDPWGNPLNVTAGSINQVVESCLYLVPQVTGGDANTAINVTGLFRRTKP